MKPLSERDENSQSRFHLALDEIQVGMKPLSERDENKGVAPEALLTLREVGMKPLSERDENILFKISNLPIYIPCRNEATL